MPSSLFSSLEFITTPPTSLVTRSSWVVAASTSFTRDRTSAFLAIFRSSLLIPSEPTEGSDVALEATSDCAPVSFSIEGARPQEARQDPAIVRASSTLIVFISDHLVMLFILQNGKR
ncbi:hypothetical protein D9M68_879670 [compost metagenome]